MIFANRFGRFVAITSAYRAIGPRLFPQRSDPRHDDCDLIPYGDVVEIPSIMSLHGGGNK